MKAIGFNKAGAISEENIIFEFDAPMPELGPRDLLVDVRGISVNPVDCKVRMGMPSKEGNKILGYDAAGIVKGIGKDVQHYRIGDEVYYSGDVTRQGSNAEYQAVDERIVGKKPQTLSFPTAAGLPLTSVTAYELLFDSLSLSDGQGEGNHLLIIGGAGGVGSILIQLAKTLTKLDVVATASRPETIEWVKKMGADHVINHRENMVEQMKSLNISPKYIAALTASDIHYPAMVEMIEPRGHIAMIDDPKDSKLGLMKQKSIKFSWEYMFTRSMFETEDMENQRLALNRVSEMIDSGKLTPTVYQNLGVISVENLIKAQQLQESGTVIGKNVLEGYNYMPEVNPAQYNNP